MRRIFASLMVAVMLVMCIQPCFAATDYFGNNEAGAKARLDLSVSARKSGTTDTYSSQSLELGDSITAATKVDYKIDLNMGAIKNVLVAAEERSEEDYVRNGKLKMDLTVTVKYPTSATIIEANLSVGKGGIHNQIFIEKERVVDTAAKEIKSTFELNDSNLTLQNLIDGKDTYFKNMSFELKDTVTYSTDGPHTAEVSAEGSVELTFTSGHVETVLLETESPVNHIVNAMFDNGCVLTVEAAKEPTCDDTGLTEAIKCSEHGYDSIANCGAKAASVINALGHDFENIDAVATTCTITGIKAHKTCKRCKADYIGENKVTNPNDLIIAKIQHNEVSISGKSPTCTETGLSAGKKCSVCGTVTEAQNVTSALGHGFGEPNVVVAATETTEGKAERECSRCHTKEAIIIPKIAHTNHVVDKSKDVITTHPTCTTTGSKKQYCSCGVFIKDVVVEKSAHKLTDVNEVTVAPTCASSGIKTTKKCTVCSYKEYEIIEKSNKHTVTTISIDATCTAPGVIAHDHCSVCNKDFAVISNVELNGVDFKIPALGHDMSEKIDNNTKLRCSRCHDDTTIVEIPNLCKHAYMTTTLSPATCTTLGEFQDICILCGETRGEVVRKYAEHEFKDVYVAPTCYSTGVEAHKVCLVCNRYFHTDAQHTPMNRQPKVLGLLSHIDNNTDNICDNAGCGYTRSVVSNSTVVNGGNVGMNDAHVDDNGEAAKRIEAIKEIVTAPEKFEDVRLNFVIEDKSDISTVMEEKIQEILSDNNITENTSESVKTLPLDISAEQVITYKLPDETQTKDIYKIDEVTDFVDITIDIANIKDMLKFVVQRLHNGVIEYIHEGYQNRNAFDEYISSVNRTTGKLTMHVKRFSEYVVVGYADENITLPTTDAVYSTGGGGGGSSMFTVRFHANGGTVVESVKVKKGDVVAQPITTRDGYKFDGWYTDSAFTKPYDFSTPVKSSLNLYAKWVEDPSGVSDAICSKFVDIDIDEWYHEGVHYALENGMMNGTGAQTFDPAVNVSRAMLVTVLWRAENKPAATEESAFVDLKNGEYYVDAVKWANENGVVKGVSDTEFAPDNAITREQFAAIVHRYAKLKGYDVSVGESTNILSYTDYNKISEYAIPAMQYAVGSGLIKGKTESTLNPTDRATRAEMATILFRFFSTNK